MWHPGKTGPRRAESRYQRTWLAHFIHSRDSSSSKDGLECAARTERIRVQISAHKVLALEKPRNRIGNTDAGQPLVIGLNAKAEAAA